VNLDESGGWGRRRADAKIGAVDESLLGPAEEPGLWTPLSPGMRIVAGSGFSVIVRHERATVERVRLEDRQVAAAAAQARSLARAEAATELVWWIGELSRPAVLEERLMAEGLVPYAEDPRLVTLTIDRPPPAPGGVEVLRVGDLGAYRDAVEVGWDAWGMPESERDRRRAADAARWEHDEATGMIEYHLARVDGRPAGFSRLVVTEVAGLLMGGAVAPWARGRGAYRALVHARWEAAVDRGTPRLVTAAGAMSTPVLERLGFARIGAVRLLRDPRL
jgi:hypothetical protein